MLESIILSNLIYNEEYTRKVIPYLKASYFPDPIHRWVYTLASEYINKYNSCPTLEALAVNLRQRSDISEEEFKNVVNFVSDNIKKEKQDLQWLIDSTEQYCQDKAIYNALYESLDIIDDKEGKHPRSAIPEILQSALAVTFDTRVGLDFLEGAEEQYDFMHAVHKKVPFGIAMLDKVTKGGVHGKTLNVFLGGVGFGKTMFMCHFAGTNLVQGKKVLYITLEMSENEIKKRIDANLLDVSLDDINSIGRELYIKKHEDLKVKTLGKLIIQEYPEGTVSASHFKRLLHDLKIKKNFVPDVVYLDYINLCASSRIKLSPNVGMYEYIKLVCQEIRGLAKTLDIPIISATQLNRDGIKSSDPDMTNTSESIGLPATVDMLFVIIQGETLHKHGQVMVKQLKNRYSDHLRDNKFCLGVHREKMRLYDVEQKAQDDVLNTEDKPVFDNTTIAKKSFEDFV